MVQKLYLDWSDIDQMVEDLRSQIEESGITLHSITGIPRGGLVAATCLSHALGLPYIPFEAAKDTPERRRQFILVVDDICDTGKTFQDIEVYGFQTAALFLRLDSPFKPEFISRISEDDSWIVFPWERKDSKTIQDYLA